MAQIQKAYPLTTVWQKLEPADTARLGLILQNQSVNTDSILVAEGEQAVDFAGIEVPPSGVLYEDILPPSGEIWAKCRTGAQTLTLILKYRG